MYTIQKNTFTHYALTLMPRHLVTKMQNENVSVMCICSVSERASERDSEWRRGIFMFLFISASQLCVCAAMDVCVCVCLKIRLTERDCSPCAGWCFSLLLICLDGVVRWGDFSHMYSKNRCGSQFVSHQFPLTIHNGIMKFTCLLLRIWIGQYFTQLLLVARPFAPSIVACSAFDPCDPQQTIGYTVSTFVWLVDCTWDIICKHSHRIHIVMKRFFTREKPQQRT